MADSRPMSDQESPKHPRYHHHHHEHKGVKHRVQVIWLSVFVTKNRLEINHNSV